MKKIISFLTVLLVFMLMITGCNTEKQSFSSLSIRVPDQSWITEAMIDEKIRPCINFSPSAESELHLTVYELSRGIDRIICDSEGNITERQEDGYIKILWAEKKNGEIIKSDFLEAHGKDEYELLNNLASSCREKK